MKQYEAVIEVMRSNGGFATLGWLYEDVLKIEAVEWRTKTPFASIRRIVQDKRFFFKIRPGLWALNEARGKLPKNVQEKAALFDHSYYQGLLVELGNLKKFLTFVPRQDRNKPFLSKRLGDIVSVAEIFEFSYKDTVARARTIDVIWFNQRKMPSEVFEVEHTTDINRALLNFLALQDFNLTFRIVAPKTRQAEYEAKVNNAAFSSIAPKTIFTAYETVSNFHTKASEIEAIEQTWSSR
jgi:hypothetical protein